MLRRARHAVVKARVVQGLAEQLPWRNKTFDRVLCVNAVHHFSDPQRFVKEASRVLRPGGGFLVVSLDPHVGLDRWWLYDFFPQALERDRRRYPSASRLKRGMESVGFTQVVRREVERFQFEMSVSDAKGNGALERRSTSQLMVLEDEEFERGMKRIRELSNEVEENEPILTMDVRLYGTVGWLSTL
jgi:SAM-dependent methyltransferase